jgi:hypothetical protein
MGMSASMEGRVPEGVALEICERVRSRIPFSQCWGCVKFSKGDPRKMCFYKPPMNRECQRVNKAFDRGEGR